MDDEPCSMMTNPGDDHQNHSQQPPPPLPQVREWSAGSSGGPPTAVEAVVLDPAAATPQGTRRTASGNYNYPIATFVDNLMRTNGQRSSATPMSQVNEDEQGPSMVSIRSDTAVGELDEDNIPSVRTVDMHDDQHHRTTPEVFVDGDLVQVPVPSAVPPPPAAAVEPQQKQQQVEKQMQGHTKTEHQQVSPTSSMKQKVKRPGGLRKLGNIFRRGRGKDKAKQKTKPKEKSVRSSISSGTASTAPPQATPNVPPMPQALTMQHESTFGTSNISSVTGTERSSPSRLHMQHAGDSYRSHESRRNSVASSDYDDVSHSYDLTEGRSLGNSSRELNSYAAYRGSGQPGEESLIALTVDPPAAAMPAHRAAPPQAAPPVTGSATTTTSSNVHESVVASFMGTADQVAPVIEAGVLPAEYAYFDDLDEKKDETIPLSLVDYDYKVDKEDAPDVDTMMRRAVYETTTDLAVSMNDNEAADGLDEDGARPFLQRRGKSDGSGSVALSQAVPGDATVHNDKLKVVLVAAPGIDKTWLARAIRDSPNNKKSRKATTLRVDVHKWQPDKADIKCTLWDVQGTAASEMHADSANFGAHPGTQSLFFSRESLYLLVWDLAVSNPKTMRLEQSYDDDDDEDSEDDDYGDEFLREQANRQADQALYADIQSRILSWVDCIARRGPNSAILPIAVIPEGMKEDEAKRRCDVMQNLLEQHVRRFVGDETAPKLLTGADNILCVDFWSGFGVEQVQEMILAIATDTSGSVFEHVGTSVPRGTMSVLELVRRLKKDHKFILVDYMLSELGSILSVGDVYAALHFLSSVGEVLYFGAADDEVLSRYVILDRKWLISALSSILRNDLKREVEETRRFMRVQCIYGEEHYQESDLIKTLTSGTSNCPLLSDSDAHMLWQSMSFMREAADRFSELAETSMTAPTMFYFLERLLVHAGIFMPLGASDSEQSEVFFVPSLLTQGDSRHIWTYRTSESWLTTLCHTWLFRDGVPSDLMEYISVRLLVDLYDFACAFSSDSSISTTSQPAHPDRISRAQTLPVGRRSRQDFMRDYDAQTVGRIRIHQLMCWKSSMLVKIGTVFADQDNGELRESYVEIFVAIVDQSSSQCVASDAMRTSMQRVVVSGKGPVGKQGRKLWMGGYKVVLDSVRSALNGLANIDHQVVCPECLAHATPQSACTWSWDSVLAIAESGSSIVRCMRGHRVNSHLICGTCNKQQEREQIQETPSTLRVTRIKKPVKEILPSAVVVALWDVQRAEICSVGSGVVVDKKLGLIVTAAHVLFNMQSGNDFGAKYFGRLDAKVAIGVIPDDGHDAVWRYMGEVVADDVHNVDVCVVQIKSRLEDDVDDEGEGIAFQVEEDLDDVPAEQFMSQKVTNKFELEEHIRVLGFNQGGEDVFRRGRHVNRTADFANGYICKSFKASLSDDSSQSSDSSLPIAFQPREELVIICPTISGHSGGPCVNDDGKVVGIVSRVDPVDRQRCYLVPGSEIKKLVNKAKQEIARMSSMRKSA